MGPLSAPFGRAIQRKHRGPVRTDIVDLCELAMVQVTTENELYPIDHLFDGRDGPGGSCWVAASTGPQSIVLRFHRPLGMLDSIVIESEERACQSEQTIELAIWSGDSQSRFEGTSRQLVYAPYGPSFHRTAWDLHERGVTHVNVRITPGRPAACASLTSIVLRSAA